MNNEIGKSILRLERNRNLALRKAHGDCIHVHWGRVWVTLTGDLRDHVISSGESLAIDRPGTTVLTAITDAGVSLMKRCAQTAAAVSVVMQQSGAAVTGEASGAANTVAASAVARGKPVARDDPEYGEIERHVDRARQLRARYVADVLENARAVLRRVLTG